MEGGAGKLDDEACTRTGCEAWAGFDVEAAAELLDALAHAAEAVALAGAGFGGAAVVVDFKGGEAVGGSGEAHGAPGGVGVANDVGDGFPDGEREDRLFAGFKRGRRSFAGESDAGGLEGEAGLLDLSGEAFAAVAADGLADFGERGAGGAFDVGDFGGGAGGFIGRAASDETAGELGFEDDDREGVAEDIVEVAGDALALGDGGELYVFGLGAAEFWRRRAWSARRRRC